MRIVVIGATGHIGSYLVPLLVRAGHEVVAVSRSQRAPYYEDSAWQSVYSVALDRSALETQGSFGTAIAKLKVDNDVGLICFTLASARQLVAAVGSDVQHLLHCGTIWVYGDSSQRPSKETHPRQPLGEYGRNKAGIESWLLAQAREAELPVTVLHPGHIVGPGWVPLNPAGNFNPQVFADLAAGNTISLPNLGLETLHHIHAEDVAKGFMQAILHRDTAIGKSFNLVADTAHTLKGYAQALSDWYGQPCNIEYLPLEQLQKRITDEDYQATLEHIAHSPCCDNSRARHLLNFQPRYSALQAIQTAL